MPSDMPSVVKAIRAGEVHMPTSSEVLQEFPWALPCLIVALVVAFLLLAGCLGGCFGQRDCWRRAARGLLAG